MDEGTLQFENTLEPQQRPNREKSGQEIEDYQHDPIKQEEEEPQKNEIEQQKNEIDQQPERETEQYITDQETIDEE